MLELMQDSSPPYSDATAARRLLHYQHSRIRQVGDAEQTNTAMWICKFLALANGIAIASALANEGTLPPLHRDTEDATPLRLMFVGDSITHGHEADYTWRYRFWQWIKETETPFSFVGPYTGT